MLLNRSSNIEAALVRVLRLTHHVVKSAYLRYRRRVSYWADMGVTHSELPRLRTRAAPSCATLFGLSTGPSGWEPDEICLEMYSLNTSSQMPPDCRSRMAIANSSLTRCVYSGMIVNLDVGGNLTLVRSHYVCWACATDKVIVHDFTRHSTRNAVI